MCICKQWVHRQGFAVGEDGVRLAAEILEQHGKIERQHGLVTRRRPIDALCFRKLTLGVQKPAQIDARFQVVWIRLQGCLVRRACVAGVGILERERALEEFIGRFPVYRRLSCRRGRAERRSRIGRRRSRIMPRDHQQPPLVLDDLERERVLPGFRFAQRATFADGDAIAQCGQRQLVERGFRRQGGAQFLQCAIDTLRRNFRCAQRASGAQHDQVLECVMQLAGAAHGMDVAGTCECTDGGGRQPE